jgi:hypothetical protein
MTSAAIEAARQEQQFITAILRTVGERQLGRRPIAEITTRDVEAIAKACMGTLPKRRPLDAAPPGPKPSSVRVRPSEARDRSSVPPAPLVPTGGCECVCGEPSIGWRFYIADGWLPVCSRHMTGAGERVRQLDDGVRAGFGPDGVVTSGAVES